MVHVRLRAPLKERAGGEAEHELEGSTVGDVIRALEGRHPKLSGWILDEHGRVRQHVNVFVNGERVREDAALTSSDVVQVLPSISGGAER
jgi:MoaD family protein